ncbi:hypothetical protein R3W88_022684 [Solanum pinnatisectum]|uniref:Uncharacterized protein n=1 Tax=Solanum pinnatisectum TaxID=50273 RepID=A0AAV9LVH7_9SOLN|nr:hypothetical protein R3W88_022684 [Solanum pinnatisectum]
MQQNVRIRELTPRTSDWIYQIKAVVYGDVIPCYEDQIKLYHTYYIAGSRMKSSSSEYEKSLYVFELVFDRRTVLVSIEENDAVVLPPPTKLTLTSFPDIKQQIPRATTDRNRQEFDILVIVVNCFPRGHLTTMNKWLQELIVMDILVTQNKGTLTSFTLRSTSKSGSLISVLVDEQIIPITNAESQEDGHTFSIEAKISFPSDQKRYYVLSNYPPIKDIHTSFINKIFSIRAKKVFGRTSTATAAKLYIQSCVEKENTLQAPNTTNI